MTNEILKAKAISNQYLFTKKEKPKPLSRGERLYMQFLLNCKKKK
jgi:hypothetical protein